MFVPEVRSLSCSVTHDSGVSLLVSQNLFFTYCLGSYTSYTNFDGAVFSSSGAYTSYYPRTATTFEGVSERQGPKGIRGGTCRSRHEALRPVNAGSPLNHFTVRNACKLQ
jgi:hypothetical protein